MGYILFSLYSVGIVFLGYLIEEKTALDKTVSRKIVHIASALLWVICHYFFGCSIHWIIANIAGAVALTFFTFGKSFKLFRREDAERSYGLFYFGIATTIVAVVCYLIGEELYFYAGITYCCLALGDGFAPVVARFLKKYNVQVLPGKSLWGTATVFVVSFLTAWGYSSLFDMEIHILFLLSVGALTCITEFYGFKGTDNLFIEFLVFGYFLLYHYGFVGTGAQIVIIASPVLAVLAMYSKAMSPGGGICAFILFALVGFLGKGVTPILFITLLFLISTVVSVLGKKLKRKKPDSSEHHEPRTAKQIIAVGLMASLTLILFSLTRQRVFYYLFFLALTEQIADSMASDIGCLTKRKNVSIISFRPVERGISGGVSMLGTLSALVSSFLLATIPMLLGEFSLKIVLLLGAVSFVGTLLDSVIGALAQALYRCDRCNTLTEARTHCGASARLVKGFSIIDNIAVNHISGFITCGLGLLLLPI